MMHLCNNSRRIIFLTTLYVVNSVGLQDHWTQLDCHYHRRALHANTYKAEAGLSLMTLIPCWDKLIQVTSSWRFYDWSSFSKHTLQNWICVNVIFSVMMKLAVVEVLLQRFVSCYFIFAMKRIENYSTIRSGANILLADTVVVVQYRIAD